MTEDEGELAPPRALIVTLFGLYAREGTGWIPVAALISLMAELGVDAPAVRSAISRLKGRGVLVPERRGAAAGYVLSEGARDMFDAGDRRIFVRPDNHDEGWVLALFSVPESERGRRHQLRTRLDWLGFGTVMAGVRIAPAHVLEETRRELERLHLLGYVELFLATHPDGRDAPDHVGRWWDLDALQAQYEDFLTRHADALSRSSVPTDRDAFAEYVTVLTAWRRLPFLDPGLPASVLPPTWVGSRAADAFFALRERLDPPARAFARAVIG